MDFTGKRLLFLGGATQCCKFVSTAKEMGIYTIVTDIDASLPMRSLADEILPYSVMDSESIISWCRKNPIDGVMVANVDPAQRAQYAVCKEFGLPTVGTAEQIEYLTNKEAFKKLCKQNGVDIIDTYTEQEIDIDFNDYPLFIKPAQSGGSRGSSVCYSFNEVPSAIERAKKESSNGKVIIEKYMDGYPDFSVGFYVIDGEIYLVNIKDRYRGQKEDGLERLASAYIFPSKYTELFISKIKPKVESMLRSIGIENGPVFMQGFVDGETIRFYDPAFRFAGIEYERSLLKATGVNLMKRAICFSFGCAMDIEDGFEDCYMLSGKRAVSLLIDSRPGTIGVYEGFDEIAKIPGVVTVSPKAYPGKTIPNSGDMKQRIAEVAFLVEDKKETVVNTILQIQSKLKVLDKDGENMIISPFDVSLLG